MARLVFSGAWGHFALRLFSFLGVWPFRKRPTSQFDFCSFESICGLFIALFECQPCGKRSFNGFVNSAFRIPQSAFKQLRTMNHQLRTVASSRNNTQRCQGADDSDGPELAGQLVIDDCIKHQSNQWCDDGCGQSLGLAFD